MRERSKMDLHAEAVSIVSNMTLDEKVLLFTGKNFWSLNGVERLGLPSIFVTDGPHGLRKQTGTGDHLGINESVPATCFPTASATACSFDEGLLSQLGEALGEECRKEGVSIALGPAINIKRSPLCGRNFEYVSEDPLLAGRLAAALIRGVQSKGVGTSVKHFAANSQETRRMSSDSVIDERALREIYLRAFEIAVKQAKPWTIMSAYNKLNGTFCSENPRLLTEILRDEWGFDGAVITDWGALSKPLESFAAGLNVEMPGIGNGYEKLLKAAVEKGAFPAAKLDELAAQTVELILKAKQGTQGAYTCDQQEHLALAARIAEESAVLLINDGLLPGKTDQKIAVIGAFAKKPRYQGAGSSKINPVELDNAWDAFITAGCSPEYAPGYSTEDSDIHPELLEEAEKAAFGKDIVYIFAGLPDAYESEGFDRGSLKMPEAHTKLIARVSRVNKNVAVVLLTGSPVDVSWEQYARSILLVYLSGCQSGKATVNLLLGKANPSGKLAETFPLAEADTPCTFPGAGPYPSPEQGVQYRESIYVGYRYYQTAKKQVRYPFGYGLSYTSFEYSSITTDKTKLGEGDTLTVRCTVKNTGNRPGKEIVQLYLTQENPVIYKPALELRDFAKIRLESGESKTVEFVLTKEAFQYYSAKQKKWAVENGTYTIGIGSSSAGQELSVKVGLEYPDALSEDYRSTAPEYYTLDKTTAFTEQSFKALYGGELPRETPRKPYTLDSTLNDIKDTFIGKMLVKNVEKGIGSFTAGDKSMELLVRSMLMDLPLRQLAMSGATIQQMQGMVYMLNGQFLKALFKK
jgi:beta-glucosidase